jgi:hypothetical protein
MRTIALLVAALAFSLPARAQSDEAEGRRSLEDLGATLTFRAGFWTSTRDLDQGGPLAAAMAWGKISRPFSSRLSLFAEAWTSLRGPFGEANAVGEVREGFVTWSFSALEVRAGRQIIAWGRADGINPTDNLTAQDLTLLAPDDSDRRIGATALRVTYTRRDISTTALWVPEFRPHRISLPAAVGRLTAPGSEWRPEQVAVRVEQTGRAVDWSLSAFSGHDLSPDLGVRETQLLLAHHPVLAVGGDAAGNLGRFGMRVEAAFVHTRDENGRDPFIKNPFFSVVAGSDRTYREHLNVNVQYLYRLVTGLLSTPESTSPVGDLVARQQAALSGQTRRHQHGASSRVAYKWLHDTLEAEVAGVAYAKPRGMTVRPKVTYAVSDRVKLLVGAEFYRGDDESVFGILEDNSGAFAEARWSF